MFIYLLINGQFCYLFYISHILFFCANIGIYLQHYLVRIAYFLRYIISQISKYDYYDHNIKNMNIICILMYIISWEMCEEN